MGRIKTQKIKVITQRIYDSHQEMVAKNFTENKELLPQITEIKSKKLRNIIAGYLTRLAKREY